VDKKKSPTRILKLHNRSEQQTENFPVGKKVRENAIPSKFGTSNERITALGQNKEEDKMNSELEDEEGQASGSTYLFILNSFISYSSRT
jgi:hypothetical protein